MNPDAKYLAKRNISDKISNYGVYEIVKNRKYDSYQRALKGMVYKSFD